MRTDIISLIRAEAPARPACFESQAQWVEHLVSAHAAGVKVVRRVDTGKSAGQRSTHFEVMPVGQQSHCQDCAKRRREQMEGEGRCFPVAVQRGETPQRQTVEGAQRRFEIAGIAVLKSITPKARGADDKRLLTIELGVEFAKVDASVCGSFDALLAAFLYRQEFFGRVVRNEALQPLRYEQTIADASVEIERQTFHNSDVSHFVITPIDGASVSLACRITLFPGKANCADLLGRIKEGVRLRITGPDDLFDDLEPEADTPKPQAQAALI